MVELTGNELLKIDGGTVAETLTGAAMVAGGFCILASTAPASAILVVGFLLFEAGQCIFAADLADTLNGTK